jgi:predicted component of type VI protein secretion system
MARIEIYFGDKLERSVELSADRTTFGQATGGDDQADVAIPHRLVSPHHFVVLRQEGDYVLLVDPRVEGQLFADGISVAAGEMRRLEDGDEVFPSRGVRVVFRAG